MFQCLLIGGENAGPGALHDAREMVVTSEQFNAFVDRHNLALGELVVPESNDVMRNSCVVVRSPGV